MANEKEVDFDRQAIGQRVGPMNILLTNDDGYDAPGLHAAYRALRTLGTIYVVAPGSERSACSHAITIYNPITVRRISTDELGVVHVVDGTPADCVRLGIAELIEPRIDLIVSGINRGANAGVDIYYSGTIAAAREGAMLGIPAIAVSQAIQRGVDPDWPAATNVTQTLVPRLADEKLPRPGFWSVNLCPQLPPDPHNHIHRVEAATHPVPLTFERIENDGPDTMRFNYGASYWNRREPGPSDYSVIRDGGIAVSAVPLFGRF